MDISDTLAPKSDQLDAVDLLGGPQTFTIERVSKGNDEQPVNIHLAGFPRPWRPGKSMRRVLVASWGPDAAKYVGRRITLYCDNAVEFGGAAVGGTRIAALSHLDKPKQVPLLIKRGKSAIFTVQPLADAPVPTQAAANDPLKALGVALREAKLTDREEALAYISQVVGRTVLATKDLTADEMTQVVNALAEDTAEPTLPGAES